ATQVQTLAVRARPEPLLPPLHANRLLAAADRRVPAPLGAAARRLRAAAALRATAAARALAARQHTDRAGSGDRRARRVRLDRLYARDHQVAASSDLNHFYHRFMRIGYSQRRTAAYLHLWALLLAAYALLLRFEPPRPLGHWQLDNTLIALGVGIVVLAASVWIVYTLEIIKSRHLPILRRGKVAQEPEREEAVERALTAGGRH